MSLFSFNLLTQEKPKGNTVSGQPATQARSTVTTRDEHSFKALVADAIKNGGTPTLTSPTQPQPVIEPKEEIVVAEENLPAVVEREKSKSSEIAELQAAPVVPESEASVEIENPVLATKENPLDVFQNEKQKEQLSGRELVEKFIAELNTLVMAGKEFTRISEERVNHSQESKTELDKLNLLLVDANNIKSSMEMLLSNSSSEAVQNKILESIRTYNEALETSIAEIKEAESKGRKQDSVLLIQLNSQKATINKLTELIGGRESFDGMRTYVKKAEAVAERKIASAFGNEFAEKPKAKEVIIQSIIETLGFVKGDLDLAKDMVSRGDLMSILLATFQNKISQ